ncbi:hypothetical protein F4810DRAFT_604497 [Camillea tinctor]|nr:hypothetical protein F4810DRAFT_604497 [Camillea tinctor]
MQRASLVNVQDIPVEKDSSTDQLLEPLVMCQPTGIPTNPGSSLETQCTTKLKWQMPFPNKPKYHTGCQSNRQLRWSRSSSVDALPLLDSPVYGDILSCRGTDPSEDPSDPQVSSTTPTFDARRWSSIYLSQLPMPPYSYVPPSIDNVPLGVSASKEGIEAIVCNIRTFLSGRRHDYCPQSNDVPSIVSDTNLPFSAFRSDHSMADDGCQITPTPTTESYLVTANDIASILDIVMTGLRGLHEERLEIGCQSLMFVREPLNLKLIPGTKVIVPPTPTRADPATTISSVQPCFSLATVVGTAWYSAQVSKSTIISRQSITEVN